MCAHVRVYVCVHKTVSYETLEHLLHEAKTVSLGKQKEAKQNSSHKRIRRAEAFSINKTLSRANL